MDKFIKLGGCRKAHGIKGGLHFHLYSGNESILIKGETILLRPENDQSELPKDGKSFCISQLSAGPKRVAYLKGLEHRNDVDKIIPFEIFLEREKFPECEEGEFYISDLEGLKVFDHNTKEEIGIVKGHSDNTAQIILMIRGKVEIDLPFVDHFFPVIDIENKRIEMIIPEIL